MTPFTPGPQLFLFLLSRGGGDRYGRFIRVGDLEKVNFLRGDGGGEGLQGLGEIHVEFRLGS